MDRLHALGSKPVADRTRKLKLGLFSTKDNPPVVHPANLFIKHFTIEKDKRAKRLILSGGGHLLRDGEMMHAWQGVYRCFYILTLEKELRQCLDARWLGLRENLRGFRERSSLWIRCVIRSSVQRAGTTS